MADFLDKLPAVDNVVDDHLGDDGVLTHEGNTFELRGPFDVETITQNDGEAGTVLQIATYSVQASKIPEDPRGGTLVVRGVSYAVTDFDPDEAGRTVLILDKYNASA